MTTLVKSRAFGVGGNLQRLLDNDNVDPEDKISTTLGGRIDVAHIFDDIKVRMHASEGQSAVEALWC